MPLTFLLDYLAFSDKILLGKFKARYYGAFYVFVFLFTEGVNLETLENLETEMENFVRIHPEFSFLECLFYDFADALHSLSIVKLAGEEPDLVAANCKMMHLLQKILVFEESYHGERDPNHLWRFLGDIVHRIQS